MSGVIAHAEIEIAAPAANVWRALTDPEIVATYFFGAQVESDWQPGSSITWRGEFDGKSFEDNGEVLEVVPGRRLVLTHYSPLTGLPDLPENYHTIAYELVERGNSTHLSLDQDNNGDEDEAARARDNWTAMLGALKKVVEQDS
jgi:uncharacterized protein YndB with AHSA1/START domain